MDGLTSTERVLLFVILGLLGAALLVQMGQRNVVPLDSPSPKMQLSGVQPRPERSDAVDPAQATRTD